MNENRLGLENLSYDNPLSTMMFQWLEGDSLAPPCQCEDDVINPLLNLLEQYLSDSSVNSDSSHHTLFDLGCGDGRICIAACQRFPCCKSVGVEIETSLVDAFKRNIDLHNLNDRVKAIAGDLLEINLSEATVVVIYLLPEAIELLKPKLIEFLRRDQDSKLPSPTVCSISWRIKGLAPKSVEYAGLCNNVNLYLYDRSSLPNDL